jgi:hypothetical protein
MKKDLNEEISRIKNMMGRITNESFDDLSYKVEHRSKFESSEQLVKSITDRLLTAVQMQEWSLVEEVAMDALNYVKSMEVKRGLDKYDELDNNQIDDFDTQIQPEEMPGYDESSYDDMVSESEKNRIKGLHEQNRQLMVRRHIKMTNTEGKTLLFDVTTVESNNEGCVFDGDFRGNYDSIKNFLGLGTDGKGHSFKFDCSTPATIMLNDADDMTYMSEPDGSSAKFVGKSVKYTLDAEGQKVLSNLCKCSRYK